MNTNIAAMKICYFPRRPRDRKNFTLFVAETNTLHVYPTEDAQDLAARTFASIDMAVEFNVAIPR